MSEKEQVLQIINELPDYKMGRLLIFLQGMKLDDDIEDDLYCEHLVEEYLDNDDPEKHETISLEDFARQEGIQL